MRNAIAAKARGAVGNLRDELNGLADTDDTLAGSISSLSGSLSDKASITAGNTWYGTQNYLNGSDFTTISLTPSTGVGQFQSLGATPLAAGNLTGSIADARLSSNIPVKNAANTFTAAQTIAAGTITSSAPGESITQTWNSAGVTFIGRDINITDTSSAAASLIEQWRVGGTAQGSISKAGLLRAVTIGVGGTGASPNITLSSSSGSQLSFGGNLQYNSTLGFCFSANLASGKQVSLSGPSSEGDLLVQPVGSSTRCKLIVRAVAAQSATMQEWQSSASAILASIGAAGELVSASTLSPGTYTVATLPTAGTARRIAYASNGRKNGEGSGAGTGVLVFDDGTAWRAVDTGATVAA